MGSQISANMKAAEAARNNSKWYEEQAQLAIQSMHRQMRITETQYAQALGTQTSAYARGGVDTGSGSALGVLAGTLANGIEELAAVRKKGEMDIKLARSRSLLEADQAQQLGSFGANAMQAAGTFMTNYANTQGFGKGFPDSLVPTGKPPSFLGGGSGGSYLYGGAPAQLPSYYGGSSSSYLFGSSNGYSVTGGYK